MIKSREKMNDLPQQICWPDFDKHQFDLALEEFKKRPRRFGR